MDNNELMHYGVLGMRWGIRKDRSSSGILKRKSKQSAEDKKEETVEERRSRLLKSTNASEIYKHRDILTTQEIKERIDRIDTERRLRDISEKSKKTGMDYINSALKYGNKANEIYEFMNKPIMKAIKNKITGEKEGKKLSIEEAYKIRNQLTDKELSDVVKRAATEKSLKSFVDDLNPVIKESKKIDFRNAYRNINNLTDEELSDAVKRATNENAFKKIMEELNK